MIEFWFACDVSRKPSNGCVEELRDKTTVWSFIYFPHNQWKWFVKVNLSGETTVYYSRKTDSTLFPRQLATRQFNFIGLHRSRKLQLIKMINESQCMKELLLLSKTRKHVVIPVNIFHFNIYYLIWL